MFNDENWFDKDLSKAQAAYPLVTERVVSRTRRLFKSQLRARHLVATEVANIAKTLLEDMVAKQAPRPEGVRED